MVDIILFCNGESVMFNVSDVVVYFWSIGEMSSSINVVFEFGIFVIYIVSIIDVYDCEIVESMIVIILLVVSFVFSYIFDLL